MIFVDLFIAFLKVGLFSFGGAYGAIPLIRDVVMSYGWLTDEALSNMIAVSESTPGPIMVNLATYVGSSQAGFFGSALATFAVVLPSFVVILILMAVLKNALKNPYVQAVLRGVKPAVIGIVLATGAFMLVKQVTPFENDTEWRDVLLTCVLSAVLFLPPLFKKKKISPILFIIVSAVLGTIVYTFLPK